MNDAEKPMQPHLFTCEPGRAYPLRDVLLANRSNEIAIKRVRFAFAYVSYAGFSAAVYGADPGRSEPWGATEWIVGIHDGITEPRALRAILALPNVSLRIFSPNGEVGERAMTLTPRLHGKVMAIDGPSIGSITRLFAGSANMTSSAIGASPRNFEAGILLETRYAPSAVDCRCFNEWWNKLLEHSIVADESLVGRYATARGKFLQRGRRVIDWVDLDPPDATDIARSQYLWIDAGDMSGGSVPRYRYQMEISGELARFFGATPIPRVTPFELKMPKGQLERASLSFRDTHHYVDLFRLGLPHPKRFRLSYRRRILRFERLSEGCYRLDIEQRGSRTAISWRNASNRDGHFGRTGTPGKLDGREWGYYSQSTGA